MEATLSSFYDLLKICNRQSSENALNSTKCVDHFVIHKRRKLSWCAITQSFKSFQQSFDGVFSNASLQKILKLVLSSNRRHFLFRNVGYSGRCTMINRLLPKTNVVSLWRSMFSFLSYFVERYDFFYDFYGLLKRKVNSVTSFIIFRFVVAKETYLRKIAKDWAQHSHDTLRDYK